MADTEELKSIMIKLVNAVEEIRWDASHHDAYLLAQSLQLLDGVKRDLQARGIAHKDHPIQQAISQIITTVAKNTGLNLEKVITMPSCQTLAFR